MRSLTLIKAGKELFARICASYFNVFQMWNILFVSLWFVTCLPFSEKKQLLIVLAINQNITKNTAILSNLSANKKC